MIEISFHNACLVLDPKGPDDEEKLNKLSDFLNTLEDFFWDPTESVSGDGLTADSDFIK